VDLDKLGSRLSLGNATGSSGWLAVLWAASALAAADRCHPARQVNKHESCGVEAALSVRIFVAAL